MRRRRHAYSYSYARAHTTAYVLPAPVYIPPPTAEQIAWAMAAQARLDAKRAAQRAQAKAELARLKTNWQAWRTRRQDRRAGRI